MIPEGIVIFLLACYLADIILGDPSRWPHPVRLQGRFLDYLEIRARNSGLNLKACGSAILAAGAFLSFGAATLLISIPFLGLLISIYLGYSSLALGCLIHETRKVQKLISSGDLKQARECMSRLVSRDTAHLDEQGLYQALAETASENYNDAFCVPFFYLSLLGVPWVWVYKMVSTMDSMWGYKNEKWKDLGFAGARADDILAWIPARLAALSMMAAGRILRLENPAFFSLISRDAGKMESPNAGWTMAAAAHLLGVNMGGPATYFGQMKNKPVLGPGPDQYSSAKIDCLVCMILVSSVLFAAVFTTLAFILYS
jgi:adenosylcobinamide-phosphate synthase